MPERLHIIITGESGRGRAFAVHKKLIRNSILFAVILVTLLSAGTYAGITFFKKNISLAARAEQLKSRLADTSAALTEVKSVRDRLKEDHEQLLEGSISRLDEQSKIIREIMSDIGVTIESGDDPDHSGGPLLEADIDYGLQLLDLTDSYLEILRKIPLGRPVPGAISSKFGNRTDPLVKKKAFHPGIDFRGNTGDEIRATGDGVVEKAQRNNILGNHIFLSHENGFETIYAHMQKLLVKKGERVTRGQVIGLIGNTGRSTGSHLHYGIRYNDKTIDPMKYLKIADLNITTANN